MDAVMKKIFVPALFFCGLSNAFAVEVSGWNDFKTNVGDNSVTDIAVGGDFSADSALDTSKTSGSGTPVRRNLTISGTAAGVPMISGNGNGMYLRSGDGHTLTLKDIAFSDFKHFKTTDRNSFLASHQNGNLVLDNVRLSNISNDDAMPMWGAVIGLSDKSQATISNSVFENHVQRTSNTGADSATGGVLHLQGKTASYDVSKLNSVSNTVFNKNSITATLIDAYGGVAYIEGWVGTLENNVFFGNTVKTEADAKQAFGGAIAVGGANTGRGTATIENIIGGSFENNAAVAGTGASYGGAIYVSADGLINNISGVTFTGNTADFGGAIYNAGRIENIADSSFDATDDIENGATGVIGAMSRIQMKGKLVNNGTIGLISGANIAGRLENNGALTGIDSGSVIADLVNTKTIGTISDTEIVNAFVNSDTASATVKNKFGGASAVTDNSGVLNFDGADYTGALINRKSFVLSGENTMTGALENIGTARVVSGARLSVSDGIINILDIVNDGVLEITGGNSFNGGTITGGVKFSGTASLENNGTIDSIEDSEFTGGRQAALVNSGKIERLSNVVINGLFENTLGSVFVENSLSATRTINNASLSFDGVTYTGIMQNRSRLNTSGDNVVSGGVLKNTGLINVDGGSLTLKDGVDNASVILNSGVLTIAGTSSNRGFISGDITVGDGSDSTFSNNGYVMGKTVISANATVESSLDTLNDIEISAGGVLNITDDSILRHNITGDGETVVGHNLLIGQGSLSATGVLTVNGGAMIDLEDRVVTVGTLNLKGVLNIDVTSIAANSSAYAGGGIIVNDSAAIDANSVLKITIASDLLKKGEQTGKLKIVDGNVTGGFDNILSNNRYIISAGTTGGTIVVTGVASADDVAGTIGNRNNQNTAAAWDSANVAPNGLAASIKNILNEASQYDTVRYVRDLTLVAPTDSNTALMTVRELNTQIARGVRKRFNYDAETSGSLYPSWWIESFGSYSQQGEKFESAGFKARTVGYMLGFDGTVDDDATVGFGYAFNRTDASSGGRKTDIEGHTVFAYAKYQPFAGYVRGTVSFGWADYKEKSAVEGVPLASKYNMNALNAETAAGYEFAQGLISEAGLRYTRMTPDDYVDALGQNVRPNDQELTTAIAALHIRPDYDYNLYKIRPAAYVGLSYDISDPDRKTDVVIANAAYQIKSQKMPRLGVEGGVGADISAGGWDFSAEYDFDIRENYRSHTGMLKIRYNF